MNELEAWRPGDDPLGPTGSEEPIVLATGGGRMEATSEPRAVHELYHAFSRPATDADRRAHELAESVGVFDLNGAASSAGEGRVLLAGLASGESLYATPAENGLICLALLPSGSVGCAAPGQDGLLLFWEHQQNRGMLVYGLVSNEVASVEIVVRGERQAARLGENAFAAQLGAAHWSDAVTVVLNRHDGSARETTIDSPIPPGD